jgi:hypothetical protein
MCGWVSNPGDGVTAYLYSGACTIDDERILAETGPVEVARLRVVQVLVVDDHEPFREAAAAVIGATPGFAVAGLVRSGEESISAAVDTEWIWC